MNKDTYLLDDLNPITIIIGLLQRLILEFKGKTYVSLKDLAEQYGVSPKKLRWRLANEWTLEEALELNHRSHHQAQPVYVGGLSFNTKKEAANHFGISFSVFQKRLKLGWTIEQALGLEIRIKSRKGRPKSHVFLGIKFPSIFDRDQYFGMSPNLVEKRLKRGWTEEQAVGLSPPPPRFKTKSGTSRPHSWREIEQIGEKFYPKVAFGEYKLYVISNNINGKVYVGVTVTDLKTRFRGHCSEALRNITDTKIARAIRKYGKENFSIALLRNDATNFVELERQEITEIARRNSIKLGYNISKGGGLASAKPITIEGKLFASQASAAEAYGIDPGVFNLRLASGKSPDQAAGLLPREPYENIKIDTKYGTWQTLSHACTELGLSYKTVHRRISKYKYSIEEALELEKNPKLKRNINPIKIGKLTFSSQADFARHLNVSPALICRLLRSYTAEEILNRYSENT